MLRILTIGVPVLALSNAYSQPSKTENILNVLKNKEHKKQDFQVNSDPDKCELCEKHHKEVKQKAIEDLDKKIQSINDTIMLLESNNNKLNDKIDVLLNTINNINHHQTDLLKKIESFQKEIETSYKQLFELEYNTIK